jgi:hypothetical protein
VHRARRTPGGREEFLFKKSFGSEFDEIPENARCVWEIEIFEEIKLRRDNARKCVRDRLILSPKAQKR